MRKRIWAILLTATLFLSIPWAGALADETQSEYRRIEIGAFNKEVKAIQERLIELNYLKGEADSSYWTQTRNAIIAFEQTNYLVVTEKFIDEKTQEYLFSDKALPAIEIACELGDKGENITLMQKRLFDWGFTSRQPDGTFGSDTAEALAAFQNTIWSREWDARNPDLDYTQSNFIVKGSSCDVDIYRIFEDDSYEIFYGSLEIGDKGPDVGRVQNLLYKYKYLWKQPDDAYDYFTQAAVVAFQKAHGLAITGIADEETQKRLASEGIVPCETVSLPYRLVIDVDNQRVYAYAWDGESYTSLVRDMICSTGTIENPTPVGIFTETYPLNVWHYFRVYRCWAQYSYVVQGGIMFHSVLYYNRVNEETGENTHGYVDKGSIEDLGTRASHGCIRLEVEDARWIFNNCPRGTEVEVIQLTPDPVVEEKG